MRGENKLEESLKNRLVYFYRRDNEFGYDGISIIAWTKEQADKILPELVKNPNEWYFNHLISIDKHLADYAEDCE